MKLSFLTIVFLIIHNSVFAQFDSLRLEIFVSTPVNGQDYNLSRQYGVNFGKQSSNINFSLAYSTFKDELSWRHFYNENNDRWTANSLILHNYTDSTPAFGRSGIVNVRTHGISLGINRQVDFKEVSVFTSLLVTSYFNMATLKEERFDAYLSDKKYGGEIAQGTNYSEVNIHTINRQTATSQKFSTITPAVNIETGLVFNMGTRFKFIPKINIGLSLVDTGLSSGAFYTQSTSLSSNIRFAFQCSYNIH